MSDTSSVKDVIRAVSGTPIKAPGSHPSYKELYSETVWTLMERLVDEHDRLEKHAESLHDTIKLVVNQSQNTMSEMKRLLGDLSRVSQAFKALPAAKKSVAADDADLKGE